MRAISEYTERMQKRHSVTATEDELHLLQDEAIENMKGSEHDKCCSKVHESASVLDIVRESCSDVDHCSRRNKRARKVLEARRKMELKQIRENLLRKCKLDERAGKEIRCHIIMPREVIPPDIKTEIDRQHQEDESREREHLRRQREEEAKKRKLEKKLRKAAARQKQPISSTPYDSDELEESKMNPQEKERKGGGDFREDKLLEMPLSETATKYNLDIPVSVLRKLRSIHKQMDTTPSALSPWAPFETERPTHNQAPEQAWAPFETERPTHNQAPEQAWAPFEAERPRNMQAPEQAWAPFEAERSKHKQAPEQALAPFEGENPKHKQAPEQEVLSSVKNMTQGEVSRPKTLEPCDKTKEPDDCKQDMESARQHKSKCDLSTDVKNTVRPVETESEQFSTHRTHKSAVPQPLKLLSSVLLPVNRHWSMSQHGFSLNKDALKDHGTDIQSSSVGCNKQSKSSSEPPAGLYSASDNDDDDVSECLDSNPASFSSLFAVSVDLATDFCSSHHTTSQSASAEQLKCSDQLPVQEHHFSTLGSPDLHQDQFMSVKSSSESSADAESLFQDPLLDFEVFENHTQSPASSQHENVDFERSPDSLVYETENSTPSKENVLIPQRLTLEELGAPVRSFSPQLKVYNLGNSNCVSTLRNEPQILYRTGELLDSCSRAKDSSDNHSATLIANETSIHNEDTEQPYICSAKLTQSFSGDKTAEHFDSFVASQSYDDLKCLSASGCHNQSGACRSRSMSLCGNICREVIVAKLSVKKNIQEKIAAAEDSIFCPLRQDFVPDNWDDDLSSDDEFSNSCDSFQTPNSDFSTPIPSLLELEKEFFSESDGCSDIGNKVRQEQGLLNKMCERSDSCYNEDGVEIEGICDGKAVNNKIEKLPSESGKDSMLPVRDVAEKMTPLQLSEESTLQTSQHTLDTDINNDTVQGSNGRENKQLLSSLDEDQQQNADFTTEMGSSKITIGDVTTETDLQSCLKSDVKVGENWISLKLISGIDKKCQEYQDVSGTERTSSETEMKVKRLEESRTGYKNEAYVTACESSESTNKKMLPLWINEYFAKKRLLSHQSVETIPKTFQYTSEYSNTQAIQLPDSSNMVKRQENTDPDVIMESEKNEITGILGTENSNSNRILKGSNACKFKYQNKDQSLPDELKQINLNEQTGSSSDELQFSFDTGRKYGAFEKKECSGTTHISCEVSRTKIKKQSDSSSSSSLQGDASGDKVFLILPKLEKTIKAEIDKDTPETDVETLKNPSPGATYQNDGVFGKGVSEIAGSSSEFEITRQSDLNFAHNLPGDRVENKFILELPQQRAIKKVGSEKHQKDFEVFCENTSVVHKFQGTGSETESACKQFPQNSQETYKLDFTFSSTENLETSGRFKLPIAESADSRVYDIQNTIVNKHHSGIQNPSLTDLTYADSGQPQGCARPMEDWLLAQGHSWSLADWLVNQQVLSTYLPSAVPLSLQTGFQSAISATHSAPSAAILSDMPPLIPSSMTAAVPLAHLPTVPPSLTSTIPSTLPAFLPLPHISQHTSAHTNTAQESATSKSPPGLSCCSGTSIVSSNPASDPDLSLLALSLQLQQQLLFMMSNDLQAKILMLAAAVKSSITVDEASTQADNDEVAASVTENSDSSSSQMEELSLEQIEAILNKLSPKNSEHKDSKLENAPVDLSLRSMQNSQSVCPPTYPDTHVQGSQRGILDVELNHMSKVLPYVCDQMLLHDVRVKTTQSIDQDSQSDESRSACNQCLSDKELNEILQKLPSASSEEENWSEGINTSMEELDFQTSPTKWASRKYCMPKGSGDQIDLKLQTSSRNIVKLAGKPNGELMESVCPDITQRVPAEKSETLCRPVESLRFRNYIDRYDLNVPLRRPRVSSKLSQRGAELNHNPFPKERQSVESQILEHCNEYGSDVSGFAVPQNVCRSEHSSQHSPAHSNIESSFGLARAALSFHRKKSDDQNVESSLFDFNLALSQRPMLSVSKKLPKIKNDDEMFCKSNLYL